MTSNQSTGSVRRTSGTVGIPLSFMTETLPQISSPDLVHLILSCWRLEATDFSDGNIPVAALQRDQWLFPADGTPSESDERSERMASAIEAAVLAGLLERPGRSGVETTVVRIPLHLRQPSAGIVAARDRSQLVLPADDSAFRLYEENIGELTPLIADQISVAVETYPPTWIADAILEAVTYNRRSWRYIQRILQNWSRDGRGTGAGGGHEKDRRRHEGTLDPDKYRGGNHLRRAKDV